MFKFSKIQFFKTLVNKNIKYLCTLGNFKINCENTLIYHNQKFNFTKKTHKNTKNRKSDKKLEKSSSDSQSEQEDIGLKKPDKAFTEFLKKEEQEHKKKEIEKESRRKRKEDESIKCLVLHPVFSEKY